MLIRVVRLWDRLPRPVQRGFGPALLALSLLIALSFVPAVSAHVPGMKAISRTVRKVLGLKPAPASKKAAAPKKSGQKRTQKTAPRTTQKAPPRVARETALKSTPKVAPKTAQKAAPKVAQKSAPAKAATVPFTVKSTPSGATVQINGRAAGKTPMTVKLAAGTHKLTISRSGYAPVTRTVTVKKGVTASLTVKLTVPSRASKPKAVTPAKVASPSAKRSPATSNTATLLKVGAQAPAITLKDATGRAHRLGAFRGRKVVVLFIWSLDAKAKALINELDSHVRETGENSPALVILAGGDAAAARKYAEGARLRVPLLLGGEQTARSYGVPQGTTVLYVVSEFGTIVQREVNNIHLTPIFPRPRS